MKVIVRITQKTLYTDYQGKPDEYTDTLHLEFDNLGDAQSAIGTFPSESIKDIEATILMTLKDYDHRDPKPEVSEGGDSE